MPRLTFVSVLVASLALAAASPAVPVAAAASRWCSPSGDTCSSTFKRRGARYVERRYAAKYVARDELCVRSPGGRTDCVTRPLRRLKGGVYAVTLRWSKRFPNRGAGVYTLVTAAPADEEVTFRIR